MRRPARRGPAPVSLRAKVKQHRLGMGVGLEEKTYQKQNDFLCTNIILIFEFIFRHLGANFGIFYAVVNSLRNTGNGCNDTEVTIIKS